MSDYWSSKAKQLLKSEMARRDVGMEELVSKLNHIGLNETSGGVRSKISRGKFSAAFLLQCLEAMNCPMLITDQLAILNETQAKYYSIHDAGQTNEEKP